MDFDKLNYRELQYEAKKVGIKANQKSDNLIKQLKEHYQIECSKEIIDESLDKSLDKSLDESLDKSLDESLEKSNFDKTVLSSNQVGNSNNKITDEIINELDLDEKVLRFDEVNSMNQLTRDDSLIDLSSTSVDMFGIDSDFAAVTKQSSKQSDEVLENRSNTNSSELVGLMKQITTKSSDELSSNSSNDKENLKKKEKRKLNETFELDEEDLANSNLTDDQRIKITDNDFGISKPKRTFKLKSRDLIQQKSDIEESNTKRTFKLKSKDLFQRNAVEGFLENKEETLSNTHRRTVKLKSKQFSEKNSSIPVRKTQILKASQQVNRNKLITQTRKTFFQTTLNGGDVGVGGAQSLPTYSFDNSYSRSNLIKDAPKKYFGGRPTLSGISMKTVPKQTKKSYISTKPWK